MRRRGFAKAACFVFLSSSPLLIAIPSWGFGDGATQVDDSRAHATSFVATVLERKGGSLTFKKEGGEVEILTLDDPGLTVKIDKGVVKGSRVKVTDERTSMSRTLTVELAPPG